MPSLTRWFIKTALLYLILALCIGILLSLPNQNPMYNFFPSYIHTLTFGWLSQLIFGVALWMFPKYSTTKPRGYEWLGWATYILLNTGLIIRIIFEPLQSMYSNNFNSWMLIISAILQWLAGLTFVLNTWNRVRER